VTLDVIQSHFIVTAAIPIRSFLRTTRFNIRHFALGATWSRILSLVVYLVFLSSSVLAQHVYTLKDLGTLGGTTSAGFAVNTSGQVTGYSTTANGDYHAFLSAPLGGSLVDLGVLGGTSSYGRGVNDSGRVVGNSQTDGIPPGPSVAFISAANGGFLQNLGDLGGQNASAYGINGAGQVAGTSTITMGSSQPGHAFLTAADGGTLSDLGTLGGTNSGASGVNASGQVTGSSDLAGDVFLDAFLSGPNGGPLKDLGRFGGTFSVGYAVNSIGQVTGYSGLAGNIPEHAFLSAPNGGALTDLGTLGGSFSLGTAINDAGIVVGDSSTSNDLADHAFIYTPTSGMRDLNSLVSLPNGYVLTIANGINNFGEITGNVTNSLGQLHAFLLIPIAVQLQSVVSRMTHGGPGTFDVNLPLNGGPGIECRSGGANGNFTLVFTFTNPLASIGTTRVTSGIGSVSSGGIDTNDPHNYIVNLTGVANAQVITVALSNVNNSVGGFSSTVSMTMGVLLGDINGDGFVNVGDTVQTRSQAGNDLTAANFREDVNTDGLINVGDTALVRNQSGTALPTQQTQDSFRVTLPAQKRAQGQYNQ
jgi:probable HAF family extracellular repeat protein